MTFRFLISSSIISFADTRGVGLLRLLPVQRGGSPAFIRLQMNRDLRVSRFLRYLRDRGRRRARGRAVMNQNKLFGNTDLRQYTCYFGDRTLSAARPRLAGYFRDPPSCRWERLATPFRIQSLTTVLYPVFVIVPQPPARAPSKL